MKYKWKKKRKNKKEKKYKKEKKINQRRLLKGAYWQAYILDAEILRGIVFIREEHEHLWESVYLSL